MREAKRYKAVATSQNLDFILRAIGIRGKALGRGVTRVELHFKKTTLVLVWRRDCKES